ncbi:MAG: tetratricopeptide repeat protein [Bacteroidota bacterium]
METTAQIPVFDDIAALERHVAANPASPLFARLASLYIDSNRPAQALKLCLQGIKQHPDYPTGMLMIAKAQIMLRQYGDARQTLSGLLRVLPSCTAALRLVDRMTELELEYPPYATSSGLFISHQSVGRAADRDRREQWSHQDDILPGIESFIPAKAEAAAEPEPVIAAEHTLPTFDLGALALRLEGARIPSLPEEDERHESTGIDEEVEEVNLELRPVTETLITIYEQQGRWRETIDGYVRLSQRYPERREHFENKIREIEGKIENEQSEDH